MDQIFHEKQEGSLCAQHCLNALLQGPYFTAVDLGTLAASLDDEERSRMAESGVESEEYQRFLAQPSGNMDDSGYFSVQVISKALQVWALDLLPFSSKEEEAVIARQCPSAMTAFICNYRDHWFTIRKLGNQWFNLNSLLSRQQLISDTYLAMFLAQLQQEGYSIFIVRGMLPDCVADKALLRNPYVPPSNQPPPTTARGRAVSCSDDEELQAVLAMSLKEQDSLAGTKSSEVVLRRDVSSEDEELQAALALSLGVQHERGEGGKRGGGEGEEAEKDLQAALALSLSVENETGRDEKEQEEEESELDKALRLSLECCTINDATTPAIPADPEEVRRKRLAYLDSMKKS